MNNRIAKIIKLTGLKCTKHRVNILTELIKNKKPISADLIISKLKIDKVTVYRSLKIFVQKNLVKQIDLRQRKILYEYANQPEHHHIVCIKCGLIKNINICNICIFNNIQKNIINKSKFKKIISHSFELFGECKNCTKT